MMQQDLFGTHWFKLVKKNGSETSKEAAQNVDTTKLEKVVYNAILNFPDGCIQDDILDALPNLSYASVTPRFSALIRKGLVERTGEKRIGKSGSKQSVMRIKKE